MLHRRNVNFDRYKLLILSANTQLKEFDEAKRKIDRLQAILSKKDAEYQNLEKQNRRLCSQVEMVHHHV